jgi:hypothetical protein
MEEAKRNAAGDDDEVRSPTSFSSSAVVPEGDDITVEVLNPGPHDGKLIS